MDFQHPPISSEQLAAHWMPFTANREFKQSPRIIESAEGHYYTEHQGRQIFDGLSGLWTCWGIVIPRSHKPLVNKRVPLITRRRFSLVTLNHLSWQNVSHR